MKNAIPQLEPNSAATVDPPAEILSAKEVAQDIGASKTWVYAHADELGGYRVARRVWFRWQRISGDIGREEAKQTQR
ncbi:MAG TPA: hypothetical protein VGS27_04805 [Candidatus Sulfotelmatobacter sp.]|nr:hypothetical protein [Candidatus Sulfotelmatobacter sp.]